MRSCADSCARLDQGTKAEGNRLEVTVLTADDEHLSKKLHPGIRIDRDCASGIPKPAIGQTDEIQVYDAEIEELGKFNVMVHNNFTPIGRTVPGFPGGIIPNHSDNGAVEWAYGVADWFEQGLYFPVYTAYSPGAATAH